MKKQIIIGLITGSILGLFCILGASTRTPETFPASYLYAYWFNRVMMGLFFAFLPRIDGLGNRLVRGMVLGLLVSLMFYASTDFYDTMGFFAGAVYGIILEQVLHMSNKKTVV